MIIAHDVVEFFASSARARSNASPAHAHRGEQSSVVQRFERGNGGKFVAFGNLALIHA